MAENTYVHSPDWHALIHFVSGDLFESPAQTLVNTVNTEGVMGKGIALRFKKIYPDMFDDYRRLCEQGQLTVGRLHIWRSSHKVVLNFPTKTTWRRPSEPRYIEAGLEAFRRSYHQSGIHSVAFPPLGCGNGELDFAGVVRPIMERYLADLPIPVFIYAPLPRIRPAEHRTPAETAAWLRGSPGDLPFSEVWEDLRGILAQRTSLPTVTGKATIDAAVIRHSDAEILRVWSPDGRVESFEMDLVGEVWNELRVRPMLTATSAPGGLKRAQASRSVLAVLAQLPYVRVVTIGEDYEKFRFNPTRALYLVPPERRPDEQIGLRLPG